MSYRSDEVIGAAPVTESSFVVGLPQHPLLLQIQASDSRVIVSIAHDGQVIVNPEFTVDEAAKAFWDAVRQLAEGGLA
jgi:hypothetical protein